MTNQKRKKKGKREKEGLQQNLNPVRVDTTSHSHYAIEDGHVIWRKVSNLMPFSWNFRRQTTGANDRAIKTT